MWAVGTPSQVSTYTKPKSLSSWLIASSVSVSWGLILRDCSEAFESSLRNWRVMFKIYKQIYETYISPWPGWQNLELYCTKALALQVQDHLGHGVSGRETTNKGRTGSLEPREYKNFIQKISPQTRNGAEIYIKDCKNLAVWFGCGIWGGFYQISRPPDKFEGWFFFNQSVWSVRSFWIQKTYILRQFFLGPPLRDPDFDLVTPQA